MHILKASYLDEVCRVRGYYFVVVAIRLERVFKLRKSGWNHWNHKKWRKSGNWTVEELSPRDKGEIINII